MQNRSNGPESCDFKVSAASEGLSFPEALGHMLIGATVNKDGRVIIKILVEDSPEMSAEAAANEIISSAQALGVDAYPLPQHPTYPKWEA